MTVHNVGPSDATGVELSEVLTLPLGVTIESITPSGTTSYNGGANGTWTIGDLAEGGTADLTIMLTVGPLALTGDDVISSMGMVTSVNEPESDVSNDISTESTSIIAFDYGDAPDPTYPTLSPNGAVHILGSGLRLGALVDAEANGQPSATADGDSLDDDGVQFTSSIVLGEMVDIEVTASGQGKLNAWIDFNNNGSWADAGEQIFTDEPLSDEVKRLSFMVPAEAVATVETYARFRFDTGGGLSFDGQANDGEVEDYLVVIESVFAPLDSNEDGQVDASTDGNQILSVLFGLPTNNLDRFRGNTTLTNEEIEQHVQQMATDLTLDVNEDGAVDASTDGNLILTVLFGLPTSNLDRFRGNTTLTNAEIEQNVLDLTNPPGSNAVASSAAPAGIQSESVESPRAVNDQPTTFAVSSATDGKTSATPLAATVKPTGVQADQNSIRNAVLPKVIDTNSDRSSVANAVVDHLASLQIDIGEFSGSFLNSPVINPNVNDVRVADYGKILERPWTRQLQSTPSRVQLHTARSDIRHATAHVLDDVSGIYDFGAAADEDTSTFDWLDSRNRTTALEEELADRFFAEI